MRGGWWVCVYPCAQNNKTEKTAKQSFQLYRNPLGPNFCKAHISKLVCAPPCFLSFIGKSTSNSTQKCKKKFSHILDPVNPFCPLPAKIILIMANCQKVRLGNRFGGHFQCLAEMPQ